MTHVLLLSLARCLTPFAAILVCYLCVAPGIAAKRATRTRDGFFFLLLVTGVLGLVLGVCLVIIPPSKKGKKEGGEGKEHSKVKVVGSMPAAATPVPLASPHHP